MVKQCCICGKTFETNVAKKIMCSEECVAIKRKKYAAEKHAKARAATRERIGVKICVICGTEFSPNQPHKVCCSPECQQQRDKQRAKEARCKNKQREKKIKSTAKQIIDINAKSKSYGIVLWTVCGTIWRMKWNDLPQMKDH